MASFTTALLDHGENVRPFADGPMLRAVPRDAVRDVFIEGHPADNAETRSRAFLRSAARAVEARELMSGEVNGRAMLWQP
ncbi:MAG: hypothetical protein GX458_20200 [Phyllobacteriaceae bacterium]|nr:hypothetical protein [Phyllobacteriaceae bacterium]